ERARGRQGRIGLLQELGEASAASERHVWRDPEAPLEDGDGLVEGREVIRVWSWERRLVEGQEGLRMQSQGQGTVAADAGRVGVHGRLHLEVEDQRHALAGRRFPAA